MNRNSIDKFKDSEFNFTTSSFSDETKQAYVRCLADPDTIGAGFEYWGIGEQISLLLALTLLKKFKDEPVEWVVSAFLGGLNYLNPDNQLTLDDVVAFDDYHMQLTIEQ